MFIDETMTSQNAGLGCGGLSYDDGAALPDHAPGWAIAASERLQQKRRNVVGGAEGGGFEWRYHN
jgi:hypothetical protein